jgi:hypothetical protein
MNKETGKQRRSKGAGVPDKAAQEKLRQEGAKRWRKRSHKRGDGFSEPRAATSGKQEQVRPSKDPIVKLGKPPGSQENRSAKERSSNDHQALDKGITKQGEQTRRTGTTDSFWEGVS